MRPLIVVTLALSLLIAGPVVADVCTPSLGFNTGLATTIALSSSGMSSSALQMSADFWSTCSGYGVPSFSTAVPPGRARSP